jgi:hypothetical protein
MLIVRNHRGYRIEVAVAAVNGGRFNAVVSIRRPLSQEREQVETLMCLKINAALAEAAGEQWAKRWIDLIDVQR